jgi:hypothetical protein
LSDQLLELNGKTSILIQRISNDDLRKNLSDLKSSVTNCQMAKNEYDAGAYYVEFIDLYGKSSEKLGEVLRNTY